MVYNNIVESNLNIIPIKTLKITPIHIKYVLILFKILKYNKTDITYFYFDVKKKFPTVISII